MSATASGERWGHGASYYPTTGLGADDIAILLRSDEITYDDLESVYGRRIIGYRESIRARTPSAAEARSLGVSNRHPLLEVRRSSRTITTPISAFTFVGRSDRFEADYLIQA